MGRCGIDLHATSSDVAVLDEAGAVSEESRIPTTGSSLRRWFGSRPPMVIWLEAGGQSAWAERILRDLGHDIVVANPTRGRLIAEATLKNDHVDAVTLARRVRTDRKLLCPITHRSGETQRQRGILGSFAEDNIPADSRSLEPTATPRKRRGEGCRILTGRSHGFGALP